MSKSNSPTHTAYQVREYKSGGEDRASWTRIGSAWAHDDGKGFNIRLNAFPVDGNIVVRTVKEKQEAADEAEQSE
jgi:hypothetical protein